MELLTKRQQDLLNISKVTGYVNVDDMAQKFSVTQQTIRRDINTLCNKNYLKRTHGGAFYLSSVNNFAYDSRQILAYEEKKAIAAKVASIIHDNASIILNIGTTTEQVAKSLVRHKQLKIITNNINILNTILQYSDHEVWIAGGKVRTSDRAVTSKSAVDFIAQFKTDFAVVGVSAIDEDGALLDFDDKEVNVTKSILAHCRTKILVADGIKFERSAPMYVGNLTQIDILVTSIKPSKKIIEMCAKNNVELLIATVNFEK